MEQRDHPQEAKPDDAEYAVIVVLAKIHVSAFLGLGTAISYAARQEIVHSADTLEDHRS